MHAQQDLELFTENDRTEEIRHDSHLKIKRDRIEEKVVVEAGAEITLKAGGSFLKLDPSGVTIVGPSVKINSGGSPGSGTGQSALLQQRALCSVCESGNNG